MKFLSTLLSALFLAAHFTCCAGGDDNQSSSRRLSDPRVTTLCIPHYPSDRFYSQDLNSPFSQPYENSRMMGEGFSTPSEPQALSAPPAVDPETIADLADEAEAEPQQAIKDVRIQKINLSPCIVKRIQQADIIKTQKALLPAFIMPIKLETIRKRDHVNLH